MPTNLNALSVPELYAEFAKTGLITKVIELAREEDLGPGESNWQGQDATSCAFVDDWLRGEARLVARDAGVVAGLASVEEILFLYKADVDFKAAVSDADRVGAGQVLGTLRGNLRSMLMAERTLLNLLSRLSGIATRTAAYVAAAKVGGPARVFDTRKTTPGLRLLEKYAVRCGGGHTHRLGLYDAVLIKDNHLASIREKAARDGHGTDDLAKLVRRAARVARIEAPRDGLRFVMLEVDSIEQLRVVLAGGAAGGGDDQVDTILLDNMSPEQLGACVALRDELARGQVELEASGGVSIETIGATAATGVDRISVGGLTHSAQALDIAMDL